MSLRIGESPISIFQFPLSTLPIPRFSITKGNLTTEMLVTRFLQTWGSNGTKVDLSLRRLLNLALIEIEDLTV